MRYITMLLLVLVSQLALSTPTNPVNGSEYTTIGTPQATTTSGKKIEVIEFFMYHCPACNMLEPALMTWVKKQGDNIQFKRIHVPHSAAKDPEAHLFLTLEAMQLEDNLHAKVLHTWHVEHHQLLSDQDNIDWAIKNGIEREKFLSFYNSFSVLNKLQNLPRVASSYTVDSTPTIVIDGHYLTSLALVDASKPGIAQTELVGVTLQVMDALVVKAQAGK